MRPIKWEPQGSTCDVRARDFTSSIHGRAVWRADVLATARVMEGSLPKTLA